MLLRLAEPDDALAVARVHVRSWQVAYQHLLPREYLDQLRPEERAQRYDFATRDLSKPRTVVSVDDRGIILGFATTSPARDQDLKDHGELCALYVDPECWGRGIGLALISAAREHLIASGFPRALLWVLDGNERASRFYEADGWISDGACQLQTVWGIRVSETRYVRQLMRL